MEHRSHTPRAWTVLIIEDDEPMAAALGRVVAPWGCRVQIARTYAAAMESMQTIRPALTLLDIHLPDGSGLDWLAAIRRDARTERLPVVIVTGNASAELSARAKQLRAPLLLKPFDRDGLIEAVRSEMVESRLGRGALAADVTAQSNEVLLTPRRAELLALAHLDMTYEEMAKETGVSTTTVKSRLQEVYEALHVLNIRGLMARTLMRLDARRDDRS